MLTQHNVLWHSQAEGEEVVEIIAEECLMRLRFGKFVWLTDQLLGKVVSKVCINRLLLLREFKGC